MGLALRSGLLIQALTPGSFRVYGQAPIDGGIRRRIDANLAKNTQAVLFADRLDPRQHQLPESLITLGRDVEPSTSFARDRASHGWPVREPVISAARPPRDCHPGRGP